MGKVATPSYPFLKFPDNVEYKEDGLNLSSKTLYFAGSAAGMIIQIAVYY